MDELLGEQQVVVKPLPSYLSRFNIKQSGIAGSTILGDGNISIILDISNLYTPARPNFIRGGLPAMAQDALLLPAGMEEAPSAPLDSQTEKYLLFLSDQLLFGVKAEYVVEIITNHTITLLPLVPSYILGIINLRGQIIPIVDMRILLGCPAQQDTCIINLNINDTMVGILVDTVQKMMDIEKSAILPAPAQNTQDMVSGMCSLEDGQTMLVFVCPQILTNS